MYLFTIITPAYNRAHTLKRVYQSLCLQPTELFEWVIVDDGSTDDTQALLADLIKIFVFPIQVIAQKNGGKHRAHNTGLKYARGELTVVLDSDDELCPNALRLLKDEWHQFSLLEKKTIAGILGHSETSTGNLIGLDYPQDRLDGKLVELIAGNILLGEKLPCYQTSILRMYPFPEQIGSKDVVPEGTVWMKISAKYNVRCINKVVRIYHSDINDKNALMNSYRSPASNAWGSMKYCITILNLSDKYFIKYFTYFFKNSVNCTRYALHSQIGIFDPIYEIHGFKPLLILFLGLPLGLILWMMDRVQMSIRVGSWR